MLIASLDATAAGVGFHLHRDRPTVANHGSGQGVAQPGQVRADLDRLAVSRALQLLLHGRYRHHPHMRVAKMQTGLLRLHGPRFQEKDARDDLQTIGNTMLHLLQQCFLLLQQLGYLPFGVAPVGDVFDCQENELASISVFEHLACIQQHRASPDTGKIPLDFVSLHRGVLWGDVRQQQPKLRDIPLAVAQLVNRTTLDVLTVHPERPIECAVGGDDAQILIEDQLRITDRVHNRLGERARIIQIYEQLSVRYRPRTGR